MSMFVCVLWLIALLVLMVGVVSVVIVGLGTLAGFVDGRYLSMIFGFTWRLWLGWLAATFVGFGIGYYNGRRYASMSGE